MEATNWDAVSAISSRDLINRSNALKMFPRLQHLLNT